jgi:hypothetical protein
VVADAVAALASVNAAQKAAAEEKRDSDEVMGRGFV